MDSRFRKRFCGALLAASLLLCGPRAATAGAGTESYDYSKEREFWSFQPVRDALIPRVNTPEGMLSPVDAFLQAGYESRHLRPVGPADKRTLIRRATYDLTGLPPTAEEVKAFVADDSPNAFGNVVERLLASPHYGEQWGRHWLDVVRYADTSGCNSDFPVPDAYKYRNYVIDAFNHDKPYDEFIREQIAGDLLPARDDAERREHAVATGYLAISRRFGSQSNEFHLTIADTLDNLGKTVLGLSIGCARCHDHKFDPIPTKDYYSLYGIFDSTTYSFPGTELLRHPKDRVALGPPAAAAALREYEEKLSTLDNTLRDLEARKLTLASREKAMKDSGNDSADTAAELARVRAEIDQAQSMQQKLDDQGPPAIDCAYGASEGVGHDARIQHKGLPWEPGDVAPRGFLTILGGQKLPPNASGSGRLELAGWLTNPSNPLTARVMANRIWEYHFGKGIVTTPNDFGHRGQPPTDPGLLDFLAGQFMKSGWSVKAMHRVVMLSRAYQMASADDLTDAALDPANTSLWRFNPRRLSAEEIRDTVLAASGALDPTVDAGPHPFPPSGRWRFTQHEPFVADYPTNQRSIYLMQQRIRRQPFLAVFDGADTNDTSPARPISTTALQALFMINDPFVHEQADRLAARLESRPDNAERIATAYELLYSRPAAPDEIRLGDQYLADVTSRLREAGVPGDKQPRTALASYVRVLLGSNELIWLD